mgnify:CR=1 FL=1
MAEKLQKSEDKIIDSAQEKKPEASPSQQFSIYESFKQKLI